MGWVAREAPKDPLLLSPRAFDAYVERASVRTLVGLRERLDPQYQVARRNEFDAANRAVIRQWDVVDQAIIRKSGPSGGE